MSERLIAVERGRTLQKGGAQRTLRNQQGKERLVGDQIRRQQHRIDLEDNLVEVNIPDGDAALAAGREGPVTLGRGARTVEEVEEQPQKKPAADWRASARDAMEIKKRKGSHSRRLPLGSAEGGEAARQVAVRRALAAATHGRTRWSRAI
ncbi:hypothetical protein B296_00021700 [Ensete ventricosum]|uniref:Uncharacterized protein n=1 Tax=Ensete ventricosum TaxID=4639 RepID=A0A426ZAM2_ENSVE|nr:hypothetical protein B296_00021700 [Ensete ventricosum]